MSHNMYGVSIDAPELENEPVNVKQSALENDEAYQCRFYRRDFPEKEEIVMAKVTRINADGSFSEVILLEYENKIGTINHSELSNRRIRSVRSHIHEDKEEPLAVKEVDPYKGMIDLSRRNVTEDEAEECLLNYQNSKQVHGILREAAYEYGCRLEEVYEKIGWPLYEDDRYDHPLDAFKEIAKGAYTTNYVSPLEQLKQSKDIDERLEQILESKIIKRIPLKNVKIQAKIEITCIKPSGILSIKEALKYGITDNNEDSKEEEGETKSSLTTKRKKKGGRQNKINIELIVSPLYAIWISGENPNESINRVKEAYERIEMKIKELGGRFKLEEEAKFVSEEDENAHVGR